MNILQVIHGYPPYYMAGSEVYTWNLCRELARGHHVSVFTRTENSYAPTYEETVSFEEGVEVFRINKPLRDYTLRDKYLDERMDDAFRSVLDRVRPDIVHFGHLSHLSSQLPVIARREHGIPTALTIHDFWMLCPRGQLVRPDLTLCDGPSDDACLLCWRTNLKETVGIEDVRAHRRHMRDVLEHIDLFLSPSHTLERFYLDQGLPPEKIRYSPYGFKNILAPSGRSVVGEGSLRLGFMGRVIPVKGIHLLLRAFTGTTGPATLDVWGSAGSDRRWLEELTGDDPRVRFRGGYDNDQAHEVLAGMDVLVTPSLWLENSPLVIQEAFMAGLPVITSNVGGMAELVHHRENGLLFPLGDESALRSLLQGIIDEPASLSNLRPARDSVRTIKDDAQSCAELYETLRPLRRRPSLSIRPAPWRVTFVTNPGLCNLGCDMCDTHSRFAEGRKEPLPLLDFSLVERTVLELSHRGLREIIPSTMGEPLLFPQFEDVLELAACTGIKVNLTTNGTFPKGGVAHWSSRLLPVVSDVKFSVNATDPAIAKKIMGGLDVATQLASIQSYLAQKRQHETWSGSKSTVTIQVTLMEANLGELESLLRWAIRNGVDRLKAHHLWVTWPQLAEQSLRRSPEAVARWNRMSRRLEEIAETELREDGRPIQLENLGPLDADPLHPEHGAGRCPFLGQEAWIEADGSFQVCCCPSTKRAAFGDFGSIRTSPFMELWRSDTYRSFVAGWGSHPNCQECNMRHAVEEDSHE